MYSCASPGPGCVRLKLRSHWDRSNNVLNAENERDTKLLNHIFPVQILLLTETYQNSTNSDQNIRVDVMFMAHSDLFSAMYCCLEECCLLKRNVA